MQESRRKAGRKEKRGPTGFVPSSSKIHLPVNTNSGCNFHGNRDLALETPKDTSLHQLMMAFSYLGNSSSSARGTQRESDLLSVTHRTQGNKTVLKGLGP